MDDEPIVLKAVYDEIIKPHHTTILVLLMFLFAIYGAIYLLSSDADKIVEKMILQESVKDLMYFA